MKTKVVYQAGYAYGNSWIICGYGDSLNKAREDLKDKLLKESALRYPTWIEDYVEIHRYVEASYTDREEN